MSYTDPGDSADRRARRRRQTTAPAEQGDLLTGPVLGAPPPEQPRRAPSAGIAAKERVLEQHESGHEDRLVFIRTKLKELYADRFIAWMDALKGRAPGTPEPTRPYVTADDAAKILEAAGNLGYLDDDERRNWFGALFREKGWRWVEPKLVPSLRDEMNGRMQRTWAWEPR